MTFKKGNLSDDLKIPSGAMKLSCFLPCEDAEYYPLKNMVVVLKKRMDALELIQAAWSLHQLSTELCTHLAMKCCTSEGCSNCGKGEDACPYDAMDFALNFDIPDELRERAGIPKDAPVHAELLDEGEIIISVNHEGPGLWDIPAPTMQGLLAAGVCPSVRWRESDPASPRPDCPGRDPGSPTCRCEFPL